MNETMNINKLITGKHTIKMLTGNLRWRTGILEQEWAFQTYDNGDVTDRREEWHPVPSCDGEEAP